jgi:hypothetical protein
MVWHFVPTWQRAVNAVRRSYRYGCWVEDVKPCPIDSKPLYRVYNNASQSGGRFVSNHRYLTEKADAAAVVTQGWADERQVMCVPL